MSHIVKLTGLVAAFVLFVTAFAGVVFFFGRAYVDNDLVPKKERPAVWMPNGFLKSSLDV